MKYTPIKKKIDDLSHEELISYLVEAEKFIRHIQSDPLGNFYLGLKVQLESLSNELNRDENKITLDDDGTGKSDKILTIINKAEPMIRMIESIKTKVLPEEKSVQEMYSDRVAEMAATNRKKSASKDDTPLN